MPEQDKKAGALVIVVGMLLLVLVLLLLLLRGRNAGLREFVTVVRGGTKIMSYLSMGFMMFICEIYFQLDRSICWDHLHQKDAV
jgi:amino acid transporter